MVTNIPTTDITSDEIFILSQTENDFIDRGKTDVKCPRCGCNVVLTDYDTSYTIGCENDCVKIGYRGI